MAKKLCKLAGKGKIDRIIPLVREGRFICDKCGRVARAAENLCKPRSLDK